MHKKHKPTGGIPTATSGSIDGVLISSSHITVSIGLHRGRTRVIRIVTMKRVMKKLMQIKEDEEDDEEGGENISSPPSCSSSRNYSLRLFKP